MSKSTIFGLKPFEPKRQLILPCRGGEITLYVLEGEVYPFTITEVGMPSRQGINKAIHFEGWSAGFHNAELSIPIELLIKGGGLEYYKLDVIFRLIPSVRVGQTAEIVAISYDNCQTFYENELCTIVKDYENV